MNNKYKDAQVSDLLQAMKYQDATDIPEGLLFISKYGDTYGKIVRRLVEDEKVCDGFATKYNDSLSVAMVAEDGTYDYHNAGDLEVINS